MQRDDFSTDLPVSRGQWRELAELALQVLELPKPENRYEATVTVVRLRETIACAGPAGDRPALAAVSSEAARG